MLGSILAVPAHNTGPGLGVYLLGSSEGERVPKVT